jgi:hypothetical protein
MSYSVETTRYFEHNVKRLLKKYASLKSELEELGKGLSKNPEMGTPLGNNLFKVRLAIASKGRGKSGGARVITYLKNEEGNVYLLSIYDKSEKSSISDNEIQEILKNEVDV